MTKEKRLLDGDAVDKFMEESREQHELHRIAYGEAMYNQAIQDAIEILEKHNKIYEGVSDLKQLIAELKK